MAWGLQAMGFAHLARGAIKEASKMADDLITQSKERGSAKWLSQGMIYRAEALAWLDSPAKAIPLLKEGVARVPPAMSLANRASLPIAFGLICVEERLRMTSSSWPSCLHTSRPLLVA
jgi:hypothetical protein